MYNLVLVFLIGGSNNLNDQFYQSDDGILYVRISGWQTKHFNIERKLGYTTYYFQKIPGSEMDMSTVTQIVVR